MRSCRFSICVINPSKYGQHSLPSCGPYTSAFTAFFAILRHSAGVKEREKAAAQLGPPECMCPGVERSARRKVLVLCLEGDGVVEL